MIAGTLPNEAMLGSLGPYKSKKACWKDGTTSTSLQHKLHTRKQQGDLRKPEYPELPKAFNSGMCLKL